MELNIAFFVSEKRASVPVFAIVFIIFVNPRIALPGKEILIDFVDFLCKNLVKQTKSPSSAGKSATRGSVSSAFCGGLSGIEQANSYGILAFQTQKSVIRFYCAPSARTVSDVQRNGIIVVFGCFVCFLCEGFACHFRSFLNDFSCLVFNGVLRRAVKIDCPKLNISG